MSKHNTIGKGENQRAVNGGDDKFYTKQFIADYYSNIVLERYGDIRYIEPTAGDGAFLNILPNIQGYDLKPEHDNVLPMDVFNNTFNNDEVIVGNPPFGMNASLAQKIFNHIANQEVKAICFILPKTFKKTSMHNKLNPHYHLVFEQDLIDNAFTVEGKDKHVPCVFQIWEYKKAVRTQIERVTCDWIEFTTKEFAEVAVRRAGGKAGKVLDGVDHSTSSTYFLKIKNDLVMKALQLINLDVVDYTAGVRSISKSELCYEVNKIMKVLSC